MVDYSWTAIFVNRVAQLVKVELQDPASFEFAPPCKVGDERPESPCSRATKERVDGNKYVDGKPVGPSSFEYQNFLAYRNLSQIPDVVEIPKGATNVRCFETIGIHYSADIPSVDPAHDYSVSHEYHCFFTPSPWAENPIRGVRRMIEAGGTIFITRENFDSMAAVYNLYRTEMEKALKK